MLAIAGTLPDNEFGLTQGPVTLEHGHLVLDSRPVPIHRGTPALMGAAIQTLSVFGRDHVFGFLAGDTAPHPFYTRGFISGSGPEMIPPQVIKIRTGNFSLPLQYIRPRMS